jgi:hypothetical protein
MRVLFEPDYSAAARAEQALIVRSTSPKSDALAPVVQVVWADSETGAEAAVGQVREWDPVRDPGGEKRIDMVTQNRAHLGIRPSRSTPWRSFMNF